MTARDYILDRPLDSEAEDCARCQGTGCDACNGTGQVDPREEASKRRMRRVELRWRE